MCLKVKSTTVELTLLGCLQYFVFRFIFKTTIFFKLELVNFSMIVNLFFLCIPFLTGSVIRCMRRLDELMRQMCMAAKAIGSTELENKFADAITKIKRDIVFAASLYL